MENKEKDQEVDRLLMNDSNSETVTTVTTTTTRTTTKPTSTPQQEEPTDVIKPGGGNIPKGGD